MAIVGTLATLKQQTNNDLIKKCIQYIENTDIDSIFSQLTDDPIEIEIDGRNAFAIFQSYNTKPLAEAKMEGHRRYIDIQYIHSGEEQILVAPVEHIIEEINYDKDRDLHFTKVSAHSNFRLSSQMGCILYPEDLHAPCIMVNNSTKVEKIVIKVICE